MSRHNQGTLHPRVERALEEIDAAFFSGDQFESDETLAKVESYLERWNRKVAQIRGDRGYPAKPPCDHDRTDVNDRMQTFCLDCGEELGR